MSDVVSIRLFLDGSGSATRSKPSADSSRQSCACPFLGSLGELRTSARLHNSAVHEGMRWALKVDGFVDTG
jgi:hypothetical protein